MASVTVQVQVVAVSPVTLLVPSPVGLPGVQLYVKVPVPPEPLILAAPLLPPKQLILVCDTGEAIIAGGCVTVNDLVILLPRLSVIVQV